MKSNTAKAAKVVYMKHPECAEGEIHLSVLFRQEDYDALPFKTKRKGINAFDMFGCRMPHCFPVFVSKAEMMKLNK